MKSADFRLKAREQLGGNIFANKWLTMLLCCLIVTALSSVLACIPVVGTIASLILTGPLMFGMISTLVKCARGQNWGIEDIFSSFKENKFVSNMLLGLVYNIFIALWTLLLIVPGIIKSYSYAMTFYIKQDNDDPNKNATDYITESRQMMDGNKWRLFCLDLSFIGWYILGALCFGVGVLFVQPYHQLARANFYLELKGETTQIREAEIVAE